MPESLHLLLIGCFSHLEDQRGLTKPEILCRNVTVQEYVDTWRRRSETQRMSVGVILPRHLCRIMLHVFEFHLLGR